MPKKFWACNTVKNAWILGKRGGSCQHGLIAEGLIGVPDQTKVLPISFTLNMPLTHSLRAWLHVNQHWTRNVFARLTTANTCFIQCRKEWGTVIWLKVQKYCPILMAQTWRMCVLREMTWSTKMAEDLGREMMGHWGQLHLFHSYVCVDQQFSFLLAPLFEEFCSISIVFCLLPVYSWWIQMKKIQWLMFLG